MNHYARVALTVLQTHETARVLQAFVAAGIPVIVLKGAALRSRVYARAEQRISSDVDVLVHRADWEGADVLLNALGYGVSPDDHTWTADFAREFMGETPYRKGAMVVDLHWELTAMFWFRATTAFDLAGLWSRAIPTEIAGAPALRLCPEDEVIHLCYHTAVHHGLTHPHGVRDILGVLRVEADALDWGVLTERARAWRVSVAVWAALWVARQKAEGRRQKAEGRIENRELIQAESLDALRVPRWRQVLLRPFIRPAASGQAALMSGTMRFLGVLLVERVRDLPGVVWHGLFPGRRWLQLRYDLSPRQAFWRQFAYPLQVLARGLGVLLHSAMRHS